MYVAVPMVKFSLSKNCNHSLCLCRLDTNIKTTWHVNPQVDDSDDKLNTRQGHNLMVVAATRVWEELYVCKKPAIEEVMLNLTSFDWS